MKTIFWLGLIALCVFLPFVGIPLVIISFIVSVLKKVGTIDKDTKLKHDKEFKLSKSYFKNLTKK
jgi:hypothetical protein